MALKILDNFVLSIAGLRLHHRAQEPTPDGGPPPARGSDPTLAVTMAMAISPCNAPQYCTLARPLSKRRDGHHKKALLTTAQRGHATAAPPSVAKNFSASM